MAQDFAASGFTGPGRRVSAVGIFGYMTRSDVVREISGEFMDFSNLIGKREKLCAHGLELPYGSPEWAKNPEVLWNKAELSEVAETEYRRTGVVRFKQGARTARTLLIALPNEPKVTEQMHIELVRKFIKQEFVDHGILAQWAIHFKDGNYHCHILTPTRRLSQDGFAKTKARDMYGAVRKNKFGKAYSSESNYFKEKWGDLQQAYFNERGFGITVERGGMVPQLHLGDAAFLDDSGKAQENETRRAESLEIALNEPEMVLARVTKRHATFSERELNALLKASGLNVYERGDTRAVILNHAECLPLYDQKGDSTGRYTTRTVRNEELRILARAKNLTGWYPAGAASEDSKAKALASRTLDIEQRGAFRVITGDYQLCVIQGRAGAGKSYTIGAARAAFERDGKRVIGLAPTNTVSRDLGRDGFTESRTIASELLRLKHASENLGKVDWDANTIVFIDEAAMLDNVALDAILGHAERTGAKLILVGDDAQLASIQRGGMYTNVRQVCPQALISRVRRQEEAWMKEASMDLADGRIREAMDAYKAHGCIFHGEDPLGRLVADWTRDVQCAPEIDRFVYAAVNSEVNEINSRCSQAMRKLGRVTGGHEYDVEKGERQWKEVIGVGDRVQFNSTAKQLDENLINGYVGICIKARESEIAVRLDNDNVVQFDPHIYRGFSLGYAGTIYRGQGKTQIDTYGLYGPTWNERSTYVEATRHKRSFKLYVDIEKIRSYDQLITAMSRGQDVTSSLNYQTEDEVIARQHFQSVIHTQEIMDGANIQPIIEPDDIPPLPRMRCDYRNIIARIDDLLRIINDSMAEAEPKKATLVLTAREEVILAEPPAPLPTPKAPASEAELAKAPAKASSATAELVRIPASEQVPTKQPIKEASFAKDIPRPLDTSQAGIDWIQAAQAEPRAINAKTEQPKVVKPQPAKDAVTELTAREEAILAELFAPLPTPKAPAAKAEPAKASAEASSATSEQVKIQALEQIPTMQPVKEASFAKVISRPFDNPQTGIDWINAAQAETRAIIAKTEKPQSVKPQPVKNTVTELTLREEAILAERIASQPDVKSQGKTQVEAQGVTIKKEQAAEPQALPEPQTIELEPVVSGDSLKLQALAKAVKVGDRSVANALEVVRQLARNFEIMRIRYKDSSTPAHKEHCQEELIRRANELIRFIRDLKVNIHVSAIGKALTDNMSDNLAGHVLAAAYKEEIATKRSQRHAMGEHKNMTERKQTEKQEQHLDQAKKEPPGFGL